MHNFFAYTYYLSIVYVGGKMARDVVKLSSDDRPILVFGATGDLGRGIVEALGRENIRHIAVVRSPSTAPAMEATANRATLTMNTLFESWDDIAAAVARSRLVLNCAGITAAPRYTHDEMCDSLAANVVLPIGLGILCEQLGVPSIHLSTGMLDLADGQPGHMNEMLVTELLKAKLSVRERIKRLHGTFSDAAARQPPYLAQKAMMEGLLFDTAPSAKVVRLSNFFGPGYSQPRLIPRLIVNRLRGGRLELPYEQRNYSYVSEVNAFFLRLAEDGHALAGPIIWAYGHHEVSTNVLAEHVRQALPSCYGEFVTQGQPSPDHDEGPRVPRMRSYFPDLPVVDFEEAILHTVDFWRTRTRFQPDDYLDEHFSVSRISGGSVATKRLDPVSGTFTKRTAITGYEGAGIPKVIAEIDFYRNLPQPLSRVYPRYLDGLHTAHAAQIVLAAHGDGSTVADTVVDGQPVPREAIRELICYAFEHGYLRDLRTVRDAQTRRAKLMSYYVDRAMGRLRSFLALITHETLQPDEEELVSRLRREGPLTIDGVTHDHPLPLLRRVRDEVPVRLQPRSEGPCAHGDMTILNMLWATPSQLLLIDPRGVTSYWDPLYDLGKLAFSLSGFAHCIKGDLAWSRESAGVYLLSSRRQTLSNSLAAHDELGNWLLQDHRLAALREAEPYLRERILFAAAVHYLSDAPYRYAQGRDVARALTTVLLGVKYLSAACRL